MQIGNNIRRFRENKGLTQEKLADQLGVSFQAVSSWERDEYRPDIEKLQRISEILDVSLSRLTAENEPFEVSETIYNWEHMKSFVKTTAKNFAMNDTLAALDFASVAHRNQKRKKSEVPYIYHPLNMACHALALDLKDDELIAAILLHDVVEDCGYATDELPVGEEARELVRLLTREKDDTDRQASLKKYYGEISGNPKACLIKCLDRINNLTTMSWGLSRERSIRMIRETEEHVIPLLNVIKKQPEYNNAAWLLQYQMKSMLDIYKRLL